MRTTTDRRGKERHEKSLYCEVRLPAAKLSGESVNLSNHGAYLLTRGPIAVEVVIAVGGKRRVIPGKLARIDSRNADHSEIGLAVRLDESIAELLKEQSGS